MRYSILTPTILRASLLRACESVDRQTCRDFEHLVIIDSEISDDLVAKIAHPQRKILRCDRPHGNWGHTCRHNAWQIAKGDYIYCLDDDNYLADGRVLEDLKVVSEPWAIFPILRYGERFFNDPPGVQKTDTGSILVRRDLGPWPDLSRYDADGVFVEQLLAKHPYQPLPASRPLMVMPSSSVHVAESTGNRISIFTPASSNEFIREAYDSIKDQDFYEWIVCWNNGAVPVEFNDPRVKSRILYKAPEKVGALKAYACEQATGDILLELDHDDLLMPDAIAEVKKAFADPEVGFVYSNTLHAMGDLIKRERFSEDFGWKYRETAFKNHVLDELVSFPPTPEMMSRVWFGPDHLRAFRKSVYHRVGGHDKAMHILDDSDLCCRLYLETKVKHIDKGLYVYRVHGKNSWLRFNKDIQDNVYRIYDQYIDRLVERRAGLSGLPTVTLESLETLESLPDSSVAAVRSTDTLCKIKDPLAAMKEIYRVLVPGGWLLATVPSTDGRGAFQDPRHVSFWNENSFLYYTNKNWAKYINTPVRFQAPRLHTTEKDTNQVCWTTAHLISLKDGYRPPGAIEI